MLPSRETGITSRIDTAEPGERGSNRKELEKKLPIKVSWPEGGTGHHPAGQAVGHAPPCSTAMAHMQEAKCISIAWKKMACSS